MISTPHDNSRTFEKMFDDVVNMKLATGENCTNNDDISAYLKR